MTVDDVREAAMRLDSVDRAVLIVDLLDSIEHPQTAMQDEIDAAWLSEIRRRSEDLRSGRVEPIAWSQVKAELEADLASRR
jgi:putative addiction module component (TIGR02574 family)